jgi:hypothetical protein
MLHTVGVTVLLMQNSATYWYLFFALGWLAF